MTLIGVRRFDVTSVVIKCRDEHVDVIAVMGLTSLCYIETMGAIHQWRCTNSPMN
jgi:hypothetical protein